MELNLDKKPLWIDIKQLLIDEYIGIIINDGVAFSAFNSSKNDDDIYKESKLLNKSINDNFKNVNYLSEEMIYEFMANIGVIVILKEEITHYTIEVVRGMPVRIFDNRTDNFS